jgi:hypothetical protein
MHFNLPGLGLADPLIEQKLEAEIKTMITFINGILSRKVDE